MGADTSRALLSDDGTTSTVKRPIYLPGTTTLCRHISAAGESTSAWVPKRVPRSSGRGTMGRSRQSRSSRKQASEDHVSRARTRWACSWGERKVSRNSVSTMCKRANGHFLGETKPADDVRERGDPQQRRKIEEVPTLVDTPGRGLAPSPSPLGQPSGHTRAHPGDRATSSLPLDRHARVDTVELKHSDGWRPDTPTDDDHI